MRGVFRDRGRLSGFTTASVDCVRICRAVVVGSGDVAGLQTRWVCECGGDDGDDEVVKTEE